MDQIKRDYGNYIIKKFSFKEKKQITFKAEIIGKEIISLFNNNEFDKCILFLIISNVITQIPQAQQIIPTENKSSDNNEKLSFLMNLNLTKMKF